MMNPCEGCKHLAIVNAASGAGICKHLIEHPAAGCPEYEPKEGEKMNDMQLQMILTPKQYRYFKAYNDENLTMVDIAERFGVNQPTVSRTLKKAKIRIMHYMKEGAADE